MPKPPDVETILWVTRTHRRRARPGLAASPSGPEPCEPGRASDLAVATAAPPPPTGTPRPGRPGCRHRVTTTLFLAAATTCFLAALVATAAMHFLLVQDLLDWVAFVLLFALALCFGLLGWQVLSILRSALRRTLGVLPDTGADAARPGPC